MLYPLQFHPIIKEKIWGGKKLQTILHKENASEQSGESWEISGLVDNASIVSNGSLRGKNLLELIEDFGSDLLGNKVLERHEKEFPLLIKFIDAADDLSVQVHPDDSIAAQYHGGFGKNEMWYIIEADPGAEIIVGVNEEMTPEEYKEQVAKKKIADSLRHIPVKPGDCIYIPTGTIHAIMKGVLLAEVQQSSDITYRIYDWNRKGLDGKYRTLHTEEAARVVNLSAQQPSLVPYKALYNQKVLLVDSPYFQTKLCLINQKFSSFYKKNESFKIIINLEGEIHIQTPEKNSSLLLAPGQTALIPACLQEVIFFQENNHCRFLEVSL
ncbi:MAG: mannose-6-phosphate isomerase [Bacteroidia bacterium]|nr:MAG: mannose-6-phosphate isomerase [Bacteroidia bacterium]